MIRKTIIATLLGCLAITPAVQARTYTIGTNPQGSLAYSIGSAIAKVLTLKTHDRYLVVPRGGPIVTTPLLDNGQLDFSIAASMIPAYAKTGNAMFGGKRYDRIRVVANLIPFQSGIFVKADSDIRTVQDLKGRKVPTEFRNQTILRDFLDASLATAGLTEQALDGVPTPNGIRGVQDFMAGKSDAAVFSPGAGIVLQADNAVGGIRYLSLENTPDTRRRVAEMLPGSDIQTLQPSKSQPGIGKDTHVIAASFLLLSSTHMDDATVEKVADTLYRNKADLVASLGAFRGFVPDNMTRDVQAPYHPAVVKYFADLAARTQP